MIELLIDSMGREEEAFDLLKGYGAEMNPDVANCCYLPDGVDKAEVEGILDSVDIAYQWLNPEDDELVMELEEDEEDEVFEDEDEEDDVTPPQPPQKKK